MGYPSLNSDRLHDEVWLTPKITNAHDKSQGNDECNHKVLRLDSVKLQLK